MVDDSPRLLISNILDSFCGEGQLCGAADVLRILIWVDLLPTLFFSPNLLARPLETEWFGVAGHGRPREELLLFQKAISRLVSCSLLPVHVLLLGLLVGLCCCCLPEVMIHISPSFSARAFFFGVGDGTSSAVSSLARPLPQRTLLALPVGVEGAVVPVRHDCSPISLVFAVLLSKVMRTDAFVSTTSDVGLGLTVLDSVTTRGCRREDPVKLLVGTMVGSSWVLCVLAGGVGDIPIPLRASSTPRSSCR